jgi:hypothetical protein
MKLGAAPHALPLRSRPLGLDLLPDRNFELQLNQAVDALISDGGFGFENRALQRLSGVFVR